MSLKSFFFKIIQCIAWRKPIFFTFVKLTNISQKQDMIFFSFFLKIYFKELKSFSFYDMRSFLCSLYNVDRALLVLKTWHVSRCFVWFSGSWAGKGSQQQLCQGHSRAESSQGCSGVLRQESRLWFFQLRRTEGRRLKSKRCCKGFSRNAESCSCLMWQVSSAGLVWQCLWHQISVL